MADITMCVTNGCPLAAHCYRKQAPVNQVRQSVQAYRPTRNKHGVVECADYEPVTGRYVNE